MKKIVLITILVYLISFSVKAQYTGPKPIVVGDTSTNYQVIYPLGWSNDGTFAYIHQDMNDFATRDNYYYTIHIQNMKTNKTLWSKQFKSDLENYKHFPADNTLHNYTFFKLVMWDRIGGEIKAKLNQYNVEIENGSLHKVNDLPKDISLKETATKNDSEITTRYNIRLFKSDKFKLVYGYDCTRTEDPCDVNKSIWYRTFALKGYFKSPFENRIAILVFKETNGVEEPYEYPFFASTHLEKGFMDIGCVK